MGTSSTFAVIATLPTADRLAFLATALDEAHEGVQLAAARALLAPGHGRQPDLVVDGFADLLSTTRDELARAPDELLRLAREKVVGGRDPARQGAYRLLADLGGVAAIELLVLGIGDTSLRVRNGVLQALERHLRALQHACEQDVTAGTTTAFGAAAREAARCAHEALLRQFGNHQQRQFLELLVDMGEWAYPLLLSHGLATRDSELRREFIKVLGERHSRGAVALLFRMVFAGQPAAKAIAQQVFATRRDRPFALAVGEQLARVTDRSHLQALRKLEVLPWVPVVTPALVDLTPAAALAVLALLGDCDLDPVRRQQHVDVLVQHKEPAVRCAALVALQAQRCPAGLGAVERALGDPVDAVRIAAARVVAELSPKHKFSLLTPLLGASNAEVRRVAVQELGKVSFARYLQRFDQMDERARQIAARAIAKIDTAMLDRLGQEVAALDAERRLKALRIVEFVDAERDLRQPLLELLDDPDRRVRATAIRIVELTGSLEGMKLLIGALTDPDRRVRANAIEAFEQLEDRRYVQLLTPFLRDPDNRVRANAAKALWTLGWIEAKDELADMLDDGDEAMRVSAAWAIGELAFDGARAVLEQRLAVETVMAVRTKITQALAAMQAPTGGGS